MRDVVGAEVSMETQLQDQTKEQAPSISSLGEDDFELDFRPVNKGLGFHHPQAVKTVVRSKAVAREVVRPRPNIIWDKEVDSPADLTKALAQVVKSPVTAGLVKERDCAGLEQRMGAFIIDIVILLVMVATTLSLLFASAGLELGMVQRLAVRPEFIVYPLALFVLFYIPYFTLFESSGATFGKSIMGIMIETTEGVLPSAGQVLARSLITLFSLVTAGALFLIDCQGQLTDTRVVKRG